MVSQLVFKNKRSPRMPVLIVTLDGGLGFYAENERCYYIRLSVLNLLAALSCNFKIIAVSSMRKKMVRKLVGYLAERSGERSGIIFDGVYKLYANVLSKRKQAGNWSHALLDFYDEEMELEDWCERKLVCLLPECLDSNENETLKPFQIDPTHFKGSVSPIILKIKHARLRNTQFCVWFEMCFQTLMSLFALSEKALLNDADSCQRVIQDWTSSDFNSFERISKFLFKQELDVDFRLGAQSMLKYFKNHEWLQFEE